MPSITMKLDVASVATFLQTEREKVANAVRPAAQAGSQVLYEEVVKNVAALGRKTGNLAASIYQAFEDRESSPLFPKYRISWNAKKAPHGHLVEYGHIQRYAAYVGKDGKWHTAVRKGAKGKKPSRRASQAAKDAYYVLRPGGPVQVPAKAFIRRAESKRAAALEAAEKRFFAEVGRA